jgi:pimeloyl-ACP methyl ester carboxylesterase
MNIFLRYFSIFFLIISYSDIYSQYAIGTQNLSPTDASRGGRAVATYFYYPAVSAGTGMPLAIPPVGGFPVVVVGHGFSMDYSAFTNFKDSLVPKGYIVLIANTETGFSVSHGNFGGDLSFLVNYMQLQNTTVGSIYFGKVRNKSAIIGHSMGGGATYLGANGNPNVTTTVTFSAAETTPSAVAACASITTPALVFSGQNDCVAPPASHQNLMYNALASSCKTKIQINNGGHCQYSNSSFTCDFGEGTCRGTSTILTRAQQQPIVFDYLYKWLDFYLRGNCLAYTSFQNLLTTDSRITYLQSCSYTLPVATIFNISSNLKCAEDSVRLYVATPFSSYIWSNSIADSTISTAVAGNYFAVVSDVYGCKDTSNIINITNRIAQRASISPTGSINVCGTIPNIPINASATGLTNYIWNTGDTGLSYTATSLGIYYLQTEDINGCIGNSDTLSLVSVSATIPIINPSDTTYFCPGDSVVFSVTPSFITYLWRDGADSINYTAYETEYVYLTTTDSNGCTGFSDTIYVIKWPVPIPTVLHNLDSLEADTGYASYAWYDDIGNLLSTDRIFFPTTIPRVFVLKVVDINGCKSDAVATLFSFSVGINNIEINEVKVTPNPFIDKIILDNITTPISIFLYESSGKEVLKYESIINSTFDIFTSTLSNGLYILKITTENQQQIFKLVK